MANQRTLPLAIASVLGALAVAMGAFGAHGLNPKLLELDTLEVWKTAVDYQMWHALLLALIASSPQLSPKNILASCLISGILFFSGSLYWLALGGPSWLGPITPIGGLLLIISWILLLKKALWGPWQS
jgi:uncharacterized membrane protein YgdD (TMEM256/DUF423 family)